MAIITYEKAKLLLGIPAATTDKDELIKEQILAVQEDVRFYANDDFFNFRVELLATMTFDKALGSIVISDGSFIEAGFAVGQTIQILGSDNNNLLFTIVTILDQEITVEVVEKQYMTDEDLVGCYMIKIEFPFQYQMTSARMIGHLLGNFANGNIKSQKIGRLSTSYGNSAAETAQGYPKAVMKAIKVQYPGYKFHDRNTAYDRVLSHQCTLGVAHNVDWNRIADKNLWGLE